MAEAEKDAKRHELKTKRRDYKGFDDDEFTADGDFRKRSVLAKYDEDIEGAQETVRGARCGRVDPWLTITVQGFRIGGPSKPSKQSRRKMEEEAATAVNKTLLSIDYSSECVSCPHLRSFLTCHRKPRNLRLLARGRCRVQEAKGMYSRLRYPLPRLNRW